MRTCNRRTRRLQREKSADGHADGHADGSTPKHIELSARRPLKGLVLIIVHWRGLGSAEAWRVWTQVRYTCTLGHVVAVCAVFFCFFCTFCGLCTFSVCVIGVVAGNAPMLVD